MKATLDDAPFGQQDETSSLFMRARNGESDAATELYQQCVPHLRRWLAGRVPGCDAEELAHVALVTAFRKAARFRQGASFQSWLKTISLNLALNRQRDETRRRQREKAWFDHERVQRSGGMNDEPSGLRVLARCVAALPEAQRQLLQLRYSEGKSAETIAMEQGRQRGAVAVNLHRICRRLRTDLEHALPKQTRESLVSA
ncbi:MAG: sigma-70 family RNA polymerase sigma factor [Prosthecobacter sp.]|uniref:RNA polymerase sigma factor n=1 Tax=Prosthecobacter sp. TaxID=1965333 RepID=UPI002625E639|nr:sigma-70 family RNA polymerase sigma factor [Prosthecobacter sp.]MCF7789331.1 sigma-70 family RNA polymerase sigma factor [Prosthecobacter sp.]